MAIFHIGLKLRISELKRWDSWKCLQMHVYQLQKLYIDSINIFFRNKNRFVFRFFLSKFYKKCLFHFFFEKTFFGLDFGFPVVSCCFSSSCCHTNGYTFYRGNLFFFGGGVHKTPKKSVFGSESILLIFYSQKTGFFFLFFPLFFTAKNSKNVEFFFNRELFV